MGTTFDIDLNNFQSISGASLTFDTGINLIVGQSNSGKTAIIRAINTVLTNPTKAKRFIKHGRDDMAITVQFDDNVYSLTKGNKDTTYCVNGETFGKAGKLNLFELCENNGFVQDESGQIMNIESEWDLPFPFDRTPSGLFKLFENIFCVSDSAVILKAFKDEETQLTKEKNQIEENDRRAQVKLKAIADLEEDVDVKKITKELKDFEEKAHKYFDLEDDITVISNCAKVNSFNIDEVLPPKTDSLVKYKQALADLKYLMGVKNKIKFYKSLREPLLISDSLGNYLEAYKDYLELQKINKMLAIDLSKNCPVTGNIINAYKELAEDIAYLQKAKEVVSIKWRDDFEVSDENLLSKYKELLVDYNDISYNYESMIKSETRLKAIDSRLEELNEKLSEYKVCPLCGQELKGE